MNLKQTEEWLANESEQGNTLAKSYLSLLESANPEIRKHWMEQLSLMLDVMETLKPELEKMSKMEK